jgi:hypothetical protein
MRHFLALFSLTTLLLEMGCGGGVMKNYSMKKAREEHAAASSGCEPKSLKTEVVREITDRPKGVDYLAIVRVKGCGTERDYLCGNYLCDSGNYCNEYKCELAK